MKTKLFGMMTIIFFLGMVCQAQVTLFEDNFDGSAGAAPNAGKWYIGGSNSVTQDGSGVLHMATAQTNWNPYIDSRGLFSVAGTNHIRVEISAKTIAGLQVLGFSLASGNGEGRCFIPQPSGTDTAPYALNVGPNTWSGSVATAGPYVVNPNDQFVQYRVELDPSTDPGTVRYWVYDPGASDWVDVSPTGDAITEYDKSESWMPWVMCSGWNGGGGPGADLFVDYVKIEQLGVAPTPTPAVEQDYEIVFEDDFNGSAGAGPDDTKWYLGGSNSVTQNGASVLHMVTAQTNWNPYIDTRNLWLFPGTSHYRLEMSCKTIAGLQCFGLSSADGTGNGKCFIPQPTGTADKPYAVSVGANTWTGSVATIGPFVVSDNTQFIKYRVEFDPSTDPGTVRYYVYDSASGEWANVSPPGDPISEYDKTGDWMPWIMCQGWNGGGGPGADLFVDYVRVVDMDQPLGVVNAASNWLIFE